MSRWSTYDNKDHLSDDFIQHVGQRYGGTRLGRQELEGQLLADIRGALWTLALIDKSRIRPADAPDYKFVVIGVDPQGQEALDAVDRQLGDAEGSETGIVACGKGIDERGYVLDDQSGDYNPNEWAKQVVATYKRHHASLIVAEANHGGAMVRSTILAIDPDLPVELVRATDGKKTRAQPISLRYEQGEVSHVGSLEFLEDEMIHYTGKEKWSPSRLDALVWALTAVFDPSNAYRHRRYNKYEDYESPPQETKRRQPDTRHFLQRFLEDEVN